ncbi:MAG: MFS transporter [Bryobacterales bacterium]|nr:MFS transporter [Bryobacterales bacterium]
MGYFRFFSAHRALLTFGLLTALSTSFGQTFFISLFLPHFSESFGLDKAGFGAIFGLATLGSALCLPRFGALIDRLDLRRYTIGTFAGLAIACALAGLAPHAAVLCLALFGLRLFGQGLLGHVSQTVMAREFGGNRGKALGVAGLGYPMGEALLPLIFALVLTWMPWRMAWVAVAAVIAGVLLPAVLRLLENAPKPDPEPELIAPVADEPVLSGESLWRDRRFYLVMPVFLAMPFVLTGLFLFQMPLAESKGWRPEWMAAAFTAFAVTRAFCSLGAGPLVDRLTALRLLPLFLIPLMVGIGVMAASRSPWAAFVYMALTGVSAGIASTVISAVWAEMYGPSNVGTVRSVAVALAVMSTALSPALMGWLFQAGFNFHDMLTASIWIIAVSSLIALPVTPWYDEIRGFLASLSWPGRTGEAG